MLQVIVKIVSVYLLACWATMVDFVITKFNRWLGGSSAAKSAKPQAMICFTSCFNAEAMAICLRPHASCSKPPVVEDRP